MKSPTNHFEAPEMARTPANFTPLSPVAFLNRAALVHPDKVAVIDGNRCCSWRQLQQRTLRLAAGLSRRCPQGRGTVAVLAANVSELFELLFAVPATGVVINPLNIRLDKDSLAYMIDHGGARLLIADRDRMELARLALLASDCKPELIEAGSTDYEELIVEAADAPGRPQTLQEPEDEWQALSLNYTSGTTGRPKGVVYSHRGAYMTAVGNLLSWRSLGPDSVYLWTLPMFHCNGWCFPWTLAAVGATSVCLPHVSAESILKACRDQGVTHMCGAPVVLDMLIQAAGQDRVSMADEIHFLVAAAPPAPATLARAAELNISVTHVYGLTETYGPAAVCEWKSGWNECSPEERSRLRSRQGVPYATQAGLSVRAPRTLEPVPADGKTPGELMMRGNLVMKGYLKNPEKTSEAFAGGWFHTGDLGVVEPDGYVRIMDRAKDIIISGGENISSIEIENLLLTHEAVAAAAVVATPDPKWGETPCAFVELNPQLQAPSEEELLAFCHARLSHFKCPSRFVFARLPRTSTGKIQKFALRQQAADTA